MGLRHVEIVDREPIRASFNHVEKCEERYWGDW